MLSSVKSGATKLKKSVVRTVSSARSCLRRYKGIMLKVLIVLALIALVVALVLESIKGVDVLTQGVIINHTE